MFGLERNLLFLLDSRFAARDAAKTPHLKFPVIAFLFHAQQHVVRGGVAVGHIKVENGPAVLHKIRRSGALHHGVPVLGTDSVGEDACRASAHLLLRKRPALNKRKCRTIFPVNAHFRRRQVGIHRQRRAGNDNGGRKRRIDHGLYDGVGNLGFLQGPQAVHRSVEVEAVRAGDAANLGDDDVIGKAERGHGDDVLIAQAPGRLLRRSGGAKQDRRREKSGQQASCEDGCLSVPERSARK
jgi:hypothetical protein